MMAEAPKRMWSALGTTGAVRVISVDMVLYLFVLGFLTYGYAKVSDCLAEYADKSATSTNARALAAAQDRQLNDDESRLEDADRAAQRRSGAALSGLLRSYAADDRDVTAERLDAVLATDKATAKVLDDNDEARQAIRGQRVANELERQRNPVPPPPSQTC